MGSIVPTRGPAARWSIPLWLQKKRHALQLPELHGHTETPLEKYYLEWLAKFSSFRGTVRPEAEDLHIAFDLVSRPLDLSYACHMLGQCHIQYNIPLVTQSFVIFLEACLRVDRKDVARFALENAEKLGFVHIDENVQKYLKGEQTWYRISPVDGTYLPLEENAHLNNKTAEPTRTGEGAPTAAPPDTEQPQTAKAAKLLSEEERLLAELEALEQEERSLAEADKEHKPKNMDKTP